MDLDKVYLGIRDGRLSRPAVTKGGADESPVLKVPQDLEPWGRLASLGVLDDDVDVE